MRDFLNPRKGGLWRRVGVQAIRLTVLYAIYGVLVVSCETELLFPASDRAVSYQRDSLPDGMESKIFTTSEGATGEAILVRRSVDEMTTRLLIMTHGNGELIDDYIPEAMSLAKRGIDVLLIEFPGYGVGDGKPTTKGIREVSIQAYDWAVGTVHPNPPERVVGFGLSLGTGIVCHLAENRQLDGLILCAPFSELHLLAKRAALPPFLMRNRFDNVSALAEFDGPVRILHGGSDPLIPPKYSEILAATLNDVDRVLIDGAGHNDLFITSPASETADQWIKDLIGR